MTNGLGAAPKLTSGVGDPFTPRRGPRLGISGGRHPRPQVSRPPSARGALSRGACLRRPGYPPQSRSGFPPRRTAPLRAAAARRAGQRCAGGPIVRAHCVCVPSHAARALRTPPRRRASSLRPTRCTPLSVDGVHRDMIASHRAAGALATLERPDSTAPVHVYFDWRAEEERDAFRERHLSTRSRAKTRIPIPGMLLFSEGTPRLYAPHHLQKGMMCMANPEDENCKKSSNQCLQLTGDLIRPGIQVRHGDKK